LLLRKGKGNDFPEGKTIKMEEKMKTTKSLSKKVTVMVTCASLMLLTVGAWTAFAAGVTLQENEAVWGKAVSIQKLDNGAEKRFYKYQNTMSFGLPYFVYRDGKVVEEGLAVAAPEAQKAQTMGLPFGTLSKDYYQKHTTTVQEVDAAWGKAVALRTLEDGSQERYYKYQNSIDLGYRCFLVKDDKVIASAIARVIGVPEKKAELNGISVNFVKETGVETVAEVEQIWGRPVSVKKLANGTEERYYKYGNTMMNDLKAMFLFKDGKVVATTVAN
jgi:hypothetical protein